MVGEAEPKARESRGEERKTDELVKAVEVTTEGGAPVEQSEPARRTAQACGAVFIERGHYRR